MTEAPEIKKYTTDLFRLASGLHLDNIVIHDGPYLYSEKPKYVEFRNEIAKYKPHKIINIRRKGKFMYFLLKGEKKFYALGIYHGIDGRWRSNASEKHIVFEFVFSDSNKIISTFFLDRKKFGTIFFLSKKELKDHLSKLGPDVFSISNYSSFRDRLTSISRIQNHKICDVLVDQSVYSGLGNYLRSDILYKSKLSPFRQIWSLTEIDMKNLFTAIYRTIRHNYRYTSQNSNCKYVIHGKSICPEGHSIETFQDKKKTIWWVPNIQK